MPVRRWNLFVRYLKGGEKRLREIALNLGSPDYNFVQVTFLCLHFFLKTKIMIVLINCRIKFVTGIDDT